MLLSLPSRSIIARSARSYAHQAAPSIISTTQANTGQKIISSPDDNKLTGSISVFIKAGSRYEPVHGLAHLLKNSVFKSTQKRSALSLVRETELLGGVLTSSLSREHLILSANFLKGNEGYFAEVLGDVLTSSSFTRHEFNEEALPGAHAEYKQAQEDPTVVAIEAAHSLAFRGGLGYTLYANPELMGSHESMIEYAWTKFNCAEEQAIVGTGIEAEKLGELVNQFFRVSPTASSSSGSSASQKSSYHGGEARIARRGGPEDTLLIGFKGAEASSSPAYTVLQHLLGSDPAAIKWSNGSSPLSSLPVKAFHLAYSDTGLFGLLVKAPASQTQNIASQALAQLKQIANGSLVDPQSVTRAANKAQFLVASHLENSLIRTELLGTQSLISPKSTPHQLADLYSSYSQVTPEQVIQAAKTIISSPPTTVAVGDIGQLPYFDQLGL